MDFLADGANTDFQIDDKDVKARDMLNASVSTIGKAL
jgi:hypothetical protein